MKLFTNKKPSEEPTLAQKIINEALKSEVWVPGAYNGGAERYLNWLAKKGYLSEQAQQPQTLSNQVFQKILDEARANSKWVPGVSNGLLENFTKWLAEKGYLLIVS